MLHLLHHLLVQLHHSSRNHRIELSSFAARAFTFCWNDHHLEVDFSTSLNCLNRRLQLFVWLEALVPILGSLISLVHLHEGSAMGNEHHQAKLVSS